MANKNISSGEGNAKKPINQENKKQTKKPQ